MYSLLTDADVGNNDQSVTFKSIPRLTPFDKTLAGEKSVILEPLQSLNVRVNKPTKHKL